MANTIKLKNSGTSTNVPSSLEYGELAINYADGKIFYKDSTNAIVHVKDVAISDAAPSSPVEGDMWFESDTADFHIYYDGAWIDVGGSSVANISIGSSPPTSTPVNGDLWFDSDTAKTYIYYNDGTSSQWIEVGAVSAAASGTDGAIQFASGGTFSSDASNLVWDDTNNYLGIGTTSPAERLHVIGDIRIGKDDDSYLIFEDTVTPSESFIKHDSVDGSLVLAADQGNDLADSGISMRVDSVTRMRLDSSGNLGIGTTSPDTKLHVQIGSSAAPASVPTSHMIIADSGEATDSGMAVYSSTTGNGYFRFGDSDNAARGGFRYEHSADKMYFRTGGSDRGAIDSSGNVGIGTTTPGELLDINAGTSGSVELSTTGGRTIQLTANDSEPFLSVGSTSSHSAAIMTNGVRRLTVNSSGDVGIGDTSPSYKLDVNGTGRFTGDVITDDLTVNCSSTELKVQGSIAGVQFIDRVGTGRFVVYNSGNILRFWNGADRMTMDASGNLSAAQLRLTATGDASLSSTAHAFQVGSTSSTNLIIDGNEIQARSNGAGGYLYLNADGGNVVIANNSTGRLGIGTSTPGDKLEIYAGYIHLDSTYGIKWSNGDSLIYNDGSNEYQFTGDGATDIVCDGEVRGSSKLFRIRHPLPELNETTDLAHMSVEAPSADLLYRGSVTLVNGHAAVDIDEAAGMTSGTFVVLTRNVQCYTSNETGWTAIRGSVTGSTLLIEAQDETCTDTIAWMVVAQRKDTAIISSSSTDDDGYVVVEPPRQIWSRDLEPEGN